MDEYINRDELISTINENPADEVNEKEMGDSE